jgi:hypothetical protein
MTRAMPMAAGGPSAGPLPSRPAIPSGGSADVPVGRGADMTPSMPMAAGGPSAGPLPSRPAIPSGDRPTYPSDEGLT